MDKVIFRFTGEDYPRFITVDNDANFDYPTIRTMSFEQAIEYFEAESIPCELWDRPVVKPPFLTFD